MKRLWMLALALGAAGLLGGIWLRTASAHCDTLDGPVVTAARRALDTGNVNAVLSWVPPAGEPEVKAAFIHVRQVRAVSPQAKELADRYFFETVVRVHRAGEGEPYTGLQPAGTPVSPAVAAADAAITSGSAQALTDLLTNTTTQGVAARFAELKAAGTPKADDVAAGRRRVHAYVEFVHYAEGVYDAARGAHAEETAAPAEVHH